MNPIIISVIIGLAFGVIMPMFAKSSKQYYEKLDDEKLIESNVRSSMLFKVLFVLAFITPFPFVFILHYLPQPARTYLICFLVVCVQFEMGMGWYLWELTKISKTEIEKRKFNQSVPSEEK